MKIFPMEIENSLNGFNHRLDTMKERIDKLGNEL